VAAKNAKALRDLTAQFRERETEKEYYAVVRGVPEKQQGRIDAPLEDQKGVLREALTEYRVEKSGKKFSLLRVRIHTGRLHQIRRHLTGIGYPVAGDRKYGGPRADRLYLHAWRISLRHPEDGRILRLEVKLPESFFRMVESEGLS
jgi:23S rRNA-/tRNA-specific pseudouridylate synthase